jgi:methyltransferase (TIGR00027 family)
VSERRRLWTHGYPICAAGMSPQPRNSSTPPPVGEKSLRGGHFAWRFGSVTGGTEVARYCSDRAHVGSGVVRTDDDSWEITESVGATALGVAAARAAETESDDPLISDPFARVFLDAVGDGEWDWFGAPELPAEIVEAVPELPVRMKSMVSFFASRTAFFDTFFLDATNAGISQVVILAAGLDARSWRLPWPDGVTVYELDQPRVLDFKVSTLHEHGADPTCHRVGVPVDLRQDWPKALQQAGFDASAPSAWSAEGLLMYLPATAQDLLFERVQGLTASGSRVGIEALSPNFGDPEAAAQRRERMDRVVALMAKADPQREIPRTDELWYFEEREDVGDWWARHGWQVTVTSSDALMTGYGRTPPRQIEDGVPPYLFVSAQRAAM